MSRLVPVLLLAVAGASAGAACHPATSAFSRPEVLQRMRPAYPDTSLPADEPTAGVDSRLGLVYVRRGASDLLLDLFLPAGPGPHPGVVVIHGGGWKSGDRAMEHPFARQLARRGFVVATVGYRLGPAGRFPNALLDVKAAVRWLRAHASSFQLDPARIGAVGASAGGQLVALAGASNGEAALDDLPEGEGEDTARPTSDLGAVVVIDGLADFAAPALIAREVRSPAAPTEFLGGPFWERAPVWRAASALYHVGPRSAPTLFINSTARTPLLPGRAEMRDRLRSLGVESEIVVMPGTPHPFWLLNPWFMPTVEATARFLGRHLSRAHLGGEL